MRRWILFSIAILLGAALGILYGWFLHPIEYSDTTPASMKVDYKTDMVLMVAEIFAADHDLAQAAEQLAILGSQPGEKFVQEAILFAEQAGYTMQDLDKLRSLLEALQASSSSGQIP